VQACALFIVAVMLSASFRVGIIMEIAGRIMEIAGRPDGFV
jgi:hypothetical protein